MKKHLVILFTSILFHASVSGQPCLPGGITFSNQAAIDSFQNNYPNCSEIEGNVSITGNDIKNLLGLNYLTKINGDLSIYVTDSLVNLTGLNGITSIGGALTLSSNLQLTNLIGLNGVKSIGSYMIVLYHHNLIDFSGLDSLTTIGGNLEVIINWGIESLNGLERLVSIGGNLFINYNSILQNLSGLSSLKAIDGYIAVRGNWELSSLSGLDSINPGSITDLSIENNTLLSTCDVYSICSYLANPNGSISIQDNSVGCNSQSQVVEECEIMSISGKDSSEKFIIAYPNPCQDHFTFVPSINEYFTELQIYCSTGERMDNWSALSK